MGPCGGWTVGGRGLGRLQVTFVNDLVRYVSRFCAGRGKKGSVSKQSFDIQLWLNLNLSNRVNRETNSAKGCSAGLQGPQVNGPNH